MAKRPMIDIREIPAYGIRDVASYVGLPRKTIEYWVSSNRKEPVIHLPSVSPPRFSFNNLVEFHILSVVRVKGVRLTKIRQAVWSLSRRWPDSKHPLLEQDLLTDGVDIFTESLPSNLVNESLGGQGAFKNLLEVYLERIDWDAMHAPRALYPFLREKAMGEPRIIQIDPRIGFGRPVIAGTGITTAVVASRFDARESVASLADEYGRTTQEIEEAIRWEKAKAA